MPKIKKPLPFPELKTSPELAPMVNLSDDMIQALVLPSGYDGMQRKLLRCSPTGILHTIAPRTRGVVNITANCIEMFWNGSSIETTEVMVRNHQDNAGIVYVNIDTLATPTAGYPLSPGEVLSLTLNNLNNLYLLIMADTEKAIVLYSQ